MRLVADCTIREAMEENEDDNEDGCWCEVGNWDEDGKWVKKGHERKMRNDWEGKIWMAKGGVRAGGGGKEKGKGKEGELKGKYNSDEGGGIWGQAAKGA